MTKAKRIAVIAAIAVATLTACGDGAPNIGDTTGPKTVTVSVSAPPSPAYGTSSEAESVRVNAASQGLDLSYVPDDLIVKLGQDMCSFFHTQGVTEATVSSMVQVGISEGGFSRTDAQIIVAAEILVFCPDVAAEVVAAG